MTSDRRGTGLVLGKFAPLHQGHQLVIETALREREDVIALIYDSPDVTPIPLNVRAGWIRALYPSVHVIEGWDGPPDTGDTPRIRALQETYVRRVLADARISHFYSSEFYGEHMSRALGAVDRRVDQARARVPISGSQIRRDPFAHRRFLAPVVYRDHVVNVVFLGAPCTGKTTLAEHLATIGETRWMPEYGREYWEAHQVDRRLTPEQLVAIAEEHLRREDEQLADANRALYTDTNAITTYTFALAYHGAAHPRLAELAVQAEKRYDLFFLCDLDIPYDDTWDRSGEADRHAMQRRIIGDLRARKVPYRVLSGSLDARAAAVRHVVSRYHKYMNPAAVAGPLA